ncbi:putative chromosome transmission fidelity protein [Thermochaetoides thermophila DSM 1495]|uniref:Putative chromosome transmission fidelity protein n=1 Tax=Chaetomium thermophilum (strain DSM 1495 / CBS 144.50 / IMI 039719) TaxID=759272 RepID=G0S4I8_CHATD|nr:putative chromosome transmission fidelity protein [Thermochaetoides thermophila DSM 1495]EGS20466.1 putative chromosome transmission fidelity protein [Thermochaetoides thermophila DSM 1495]
MLPNEMPTRVLDVGVRDEDPIRLHEPVGSSIRYMCLSYCWGGAKFLKTTRANYDKHKQEIRLDELPQLFQDAVRVTRSLGVRYLWIDALCIIQDDINLTDWKRESVRMASVFQNSYLTISATRAPSPHSSLFAKMETTQVGPVMVRKILHAPPIRMREGMEGTEWASNFPLFRRGWAFQERMLSPRVVHFGPHEIEWDCMKRRACQCIPDTEEDIPASFLWGVGTGLDLTATLLEISSIKQRGTLDRVCARIPFGIPLKPSEFLHMKKTDDRLAIAKVWHTTVTNFSPLELTDKSDRLAAISGMAEAMQRNTSNWQYLAGLWKETLLLDLCWHTSPYSRIDKDDRRQPTWSWAFLDGRAFMPIAEWADIDDAGWKLQWEEYAKVVDASCTLATHSSTGLVLDGCLELRCRLIPFDHSLHQMLRDFTFLDEYGSCCCEAQERLYFVPVGSFTYKKSSRHLGLILERIGEDKSSDMVRLGAVVIPIGKISRTRFDGFRSRSHDEQAATHAFRAFKEATGNEMVKIRIF